MEPGRLTNPELDPTVAQRGTTAERFLAKQLGESTAFRPGYVLDRQEQAANVLRLRRLIPYATLFWMACGILDWTIVTWVVPGDLRYYLGLRCVELAIIVGCFLRLRAQPEPSPRIFRTIDVLIFVGAAVILTLLCVEYRGIESPYTHGMSLILLVRGIALPDHWRRGMLYLGLPALAYPVTMLLAAAVSPAIAAQLRDPAALTVFIQHLSIVFIAWTLLVIGGHISWSLRRQVFEARAIGRYRLTGFIGSGGMGEVWRAHHQALRRDVAVKILRSDLVPGEHVVGRFEREVRAMAELTHPNTVRIFDYGVTDDGLWYYAMELLDGETVAALVEREGPLPAARAIHLVLQAARALAEAHARGIVHRDLKPENLFVTTAGGEPDFIKVLDFGVAKVTVEASPATLTGDGWLLGTPRFMSPEQAAGRPADARSDVYALGSVLYYALAGAPPFDGPSAAAILLAHLRDPPLPPSLKGGRPVPSDLERVVMRCLEKEPADRYANAGELAAALAACGDANAWRPGRMGPARGLGADRLERADALTVEARPPREMLER